MLDLIGRVWGSTEGIAYFGADARVKCSHFLRYRGIRVGDVSGHFTDLLPSLFVLRLPIKIHGELYA